jgi:hypothetical protein
LKGHHWEDELSTLTSVSLGSSGNLLLLQKSAVLTTFLNSAPSISLYPLRYHPITNAKQVYFNRKGGSRSNNSNTESTECIRSQSIVATGVGTIKPTPTTPSTSRSKRLIKKVKFPPCQKLISSKLEKEKREQYSQQ